MREFPDMYERQKTATDFWTISNQREHLCEITQILRVPFSIFLIKRVVGFVALLNRLQRPLKLLHQHKG